MCPCVWSQASSSFDKKWKKRWGAFPKQQTVCGFDPFGLIVVSYDRLRSPKWYKKSFGESVGNLGEYPCRLLNIFQCGGPRSCSRDLLQELVYGRMADNFYCIRPTTFDFHGGNVWTMHFERGPSAKYILWKNSANQRVLLILNPNFKDIVWLLLFIRIALYNLYSIQLASCANTWLRMTKQTSKFPSITVDGYYCPILHINEKNWHKIQMFYIYTVYI